MILKANKPKPRSPMVADIELGRRIRERRSEMKLSQADLADVLGVSFQQIQKYETGKNRVSANRLILIASALKLKPNDLFSSDKVLPDAASLIDVNDEDTLRMLRA